MSLELILPFFPQDFRNLFTQSDVTDVMVRQHGHVFIDRNGRHENTGIVLDREKLRMAIINIASLSGNPIGPDSPELEVRFPDGSRVAALSDPNSLDGWSLTIRRYFRWFTLAELVMAGTISLYDASLLRKAVRDGENILVSGGMSTGKSTFLAALIRELEPEVTGIIVMEKPSEMQIPEHTNILRWEATEATGKRPERTLGHLLRHAVRHNAHRLIFGEIKDPAAWDWLLAANSGHPSMTTIHSNTATSALDKLAGFAVGGLPNLNHQFVRQQVAEAVQIVVHMVRSKTTQKPVVQSVVKVHSYDVQTNTFDTKPLTLD